MRRWLLLAILGVLLAACSRGNAPLCVMADDFGDLTKREQRIAGSHDGWVDTGVDVLNAGSPLQIHTAGAIDICMNSSPDITATFVVNDNLSAWQPVPGFTFSGAMDEYSISVSGSVSRYSSGDSPVSGGDDLWVWFGAPPADNAYMANPSRLTEPYSFELDDGALINERVPNGPDGNPVTGGVYFRFDDSPVVAGWGPPDHYGDNNGSYTVTITRHPPTNCLGSAGEFLVAYVGETPPTTEQIVTAVNGNTEDAIGLINLHEYGGQGSAEPGVFNGYGPTVGGRLWIRVVDSGLITWSAAEGVRGDSNYTAAVFNSSGSYVSGSNSGEYIINITTKNNPESAIGDFLGSIVAPVKAAILGVDGGDSLVKSFFEGLTSNGDFINAVRAALTLAVVLYALTYVMGVNQISQRGLFEFILRMAIVIAVISPGSWEFFYNNLFRFFIEGVDDLINIMAGDFIAVTGAFSDYEQTVSGATTDATVVATGSVDVTKDAFSFINTTLGRFFTSETNIKIAGLASVLPMGPILALMIYFCIVMFVFVLAKAVLVYLISVIIVGILLFLAPIFIIFILFSKTRSLFDGWLKMLIGMALQPVVMLGVLSIFNIFIYSIFYMILSFHVCWDCVIELDFMLTEALDAIGVPGVEGGVEFDQICIISGYRPWGADNAQGLGGRLASTPTGIFFIISFMILIMAMGRFIDWVVAVMSTITGAGISVTRAAETAMKEGVATGVDAAKTGLGVAKETAGVARSAVGSAAGLVASKAAAKGGGGGAEQAGGGGKTADRPGAAAADKLGKAGGKKTGAPGEKAQEEKEEKAEGSKRSEGATGSEEAAKSEEGGGSEDSGSENDSGDTTSGDTVSSNEDSGGDKAARPDGNSDIASAVAQGSEAAASSASSAGDAAGGDADAASTAASTSASTGDTPDTGKGDVDDGADSSSRKGTAGTSVARAGVEAISSSGIAKPNDAEKGKKNEGEDK